MAAPPRKKKLNLRFVLDTVDLPSLRQTGTRKHLLVLELVWPRTGIARRSAVLTVPLVHGLCPTDAWSLTSKLCFKETCEDRFGLRIGVTEPLTATRIRDFLRFFTGKTADIAADAAEDACPIPVLDELVALPLTYLAGELLDGKEPELLAQGVLDLDAGQFSPAPTTLTLPLTALQDRDGISRQDRDGTVTLTVQSY